MLDHHYLELLAREYPTIQAASTEIINLRAIISLPKGTEYFFSDLHGEHEAFIHLLHSASGVIRKKIDELFDKTLVDSERMALALLIYYPEQQISIAKTHKENYDEWCKITLYRLVQVCKESASKYTRSKVRKMLPKDYEYIIDELLHADDTIDKEHYYAQIIDTIIEIRRAESFIINLAYLIQRLTIDMLHIIGDIFDRGPHADKIMDELMDYHDVDIQWGNHDISWIGAAAGNLACIANVLRLGISYNNFDQLEDGYGINLRALYAFASKAYAEDPCVPFLPHLLDKNQYDPVDAQYAAKMHKAIAIIQFKLEGQLILRHPEYQMNDRLLLNQIDFERHTVQVDGKTYPLTDSLFPTVDPANPLALTKEEEELMATLAASFRHSDRLQKHIRFLYAQGSMYKKINDSLLYHGCIPMREDGSFDTVVLDGVACSGKNYLERLEKLVRLAYFSTASEEGVADARDYIWYLWCGPKSPLFGKSRLTCFERYFIADKTTWKEEMNPYYRLIERQDICEKILEEFGLDPAASYIINGHVPIKIKQGESPIKANGKLFIIDGGLSKAYQHTTGIGGYTFIANSRYLALAEHQPFTLNGDRADIQTSVRVVETPPQRIRVRDTDIGRDLLRQVDELTALVAAYRDGSIKEKRKQKL